MYVPMCRYLLQAIQVLTKASQIVCNMLFSLDIIHKDIFMVLVPGPLFEVKKFNTNINFLCYNLNTPPPTLNITGSHITLVKVKAVDLYSASSR